MTSSITCKVDGCERKKAALQMCSAHYQRHKNGKPLDTPIRRFAPGEWTEWSIDFNGYMRRYRSTSVPGKLEWQTQHRVTMEEILGRALLPGEEVHHKNGVRHDNRPENLELWLVSQPAGQRVEDLVEWAKTILDRYGTAPDVP